MNRVIRSILEYLAAFITIILLLLAIAGVIVFKFHGEELQVFVMEQINEELDCKVDVEEINLKVFRKFPHASIHLEEVIVWSSHNFSTRDFPGKGADILLHAESIDVSFNLLSLLAKNYRVREIDIISGELHLYTDAFGEINYHILKERGKSIDSTKNPLDIDLTQVHIRDFHILQNNQAKQLISASRLDNLDLAGRISRKQIQLRASLDGWLDQISNKGILYASERNVNLKINLGVQDSLYTINKGHLRVDRVMADVEGSFSIQPGQGVYLDLSASARDLEIYEVLDLLPKEFSASLAGLKGNGNLRLFTRVKGLVNSTRTPSVEADYETLHANLEWDRIPFALSNLNLKGSYSNGGDFNPASTKLDVESLDAYIGKDRISVKGSIANFLDPRFKVSLEGVVHPGQWEKWYPDLPIEDASGKLFCDINLGGVLNRRNEKGEKLGSFDLDGEIKMQDLGLFLGDHGLPLHNLNGSLRIHNDFWEPDITGYIGESDFEIQGSGKNLISFFLNKEVELVASASLISSRIDLQDILDAYTMEKATDKRAFRMPERLMLRLSFAIQELSKDRFSAKQVRGILNYGAPLLRIDSLQMQSMEGSLRGRGAVSYDPLIGANMQVDASLFNIDIQQLFYAFNNFGQEQLMHNNLSGTISGTSMFTADYDTVFEILPMSILSENRITIRNGELNSFTPMLALSRFIEVEELENIRFETLANNILISDGEIIIPSMTIQSNAINLEASGMHGFDNHYDYHLKLRLSELLYNKSRKEDGEFDVAIDENDDRVLFLKIVNVGSGAKVSRDKEKSAEKRRQDLREEKNELKSILNEELGLFNKDEDIQEKEEIEEDPKAFRFEFSEEADTLQEGSKKKRRWFKPEKEKDENKPADEFVIDDI